MTEEKGNRYQISFILDIGKTGWDFVEELKNLIDKPEYPESYLMSLVMETYESIVRDTVRLLDLEPIDAIEHIKSMPLMESVATLVTSTNVDVTRLNALCQMYCSGIFLRLITQLTQERTTVMQHFATKIGLDYVVVTVHMFEQ